MALRPGQPGSEPINAHHLTVLITSATLRKTSLEKIFCGNTLRDFLLCRWVLPRFLVVCFLSFSLYSSLWALASLLKSLSFFDVHLTLPITVLQKFVSSTPKCIPLPAWTFQRHHKLKIQNWIYSLSSCCTHLCQWKASQSTSNSRPHLGRPCLFCHISNHQSYRFHLLCSSLICCFTFFF